MLPLWMKLSHRNTPPASRYSTSRVFGSYRPARDTAAFPIQRCPSPDIEIVLAGQSALHEGVLDVLNASVPLIRIGSPG